MAFFKVLVDREQVNKVTERETKGGKMVNQFIWLFTRGTKYPTQTRITLPDGVRLYPDGNYVLEIDENMASNNYGDLTLRNFARFALIPISQAAFDNFDKAEEQFYSHLVKSAP